MVDKALKSSHNINTKFHYREVTITSEDYKIFLFISKITVSQTVLHISQHLVKEKTTRKGKRKERGRGKEKGKEREKERGREKEKDKEKEKKKKKNGESGDLKVFFKAHRPSEYVP